MKLYFFFFLIKQKISKIQQIEKNYDRDVIYIAVHRYRKFEKF